MELAGDDLNNLLPLFTQGKTMNDASLLARLTALVVATLNAPLPGEAGALDQVVELAEAQVPTPVAQADDASNGNDSGHGGSGRHAGHGNGRITERSATPATASPFAGDLFGRTPGSRASADDAADDHDDLSADEHDDHHGADSNSDGPAPSARTRALAIRRSNAARAIFPANPMRPWRSPNA